MEWLGRMVVAGAAVGMMTGAVIGQEIISRYLWSSPPFAADETDEMDRLVGLTPGQRASIQVILNDAYRRARAVRNRTQRMASDDPRNAEPTQDPAEGMKRWLQFWTPAYQKIGQIETDTIADVAALLTDAQKAKGWDQYLAHRVERLLREDWGYRYSPANCLQGIKLTNDEQAAIGPLLEEYEKGKVAIARRLIQFRKDQETAAARGENPAPWARDHSYGDRLALSVRTLDRIEGLLVPEHLEAFQRRRTGIGRGSMGVISNIERVESQPEIRSVLELKSLSAEQRQTLMAAAVAANERLYLLTREEMRWQELQALDEAASHSASPTDRADGAAGEAPDPNAIERRQKLSELAQTNAKKVLAIYTEMRRVSRETLTPAQWDEIDGAQPDQMEVWLKNASRDDGKWLSSRPELGAEDAK